MSNYAKILLHIRVELFKRGDFDFITCMETETHHVVKHEKQEAALRILTDNTHVEF